MLRFLSALRGGSLGKRGGSRPGFRVRSRVCCSCSVICSFQGLVLLYVLRDCMVTRAFLVYAYQSKLSYNYKENTKLRQIKASARRDSLENFLAHNEF
jgi:hypothetical protein